MIGPLIKLALAAVALLLPAVLYGNSKICPRALAFHRLSDGLQDERLRLPTRMRFQDIVSKENGKPGFAIVIDEGPSMHVLGQIHYEVSAQNNNAFSITYNTKVASAFRRQGLGAKLIAKALATLPKEAGAQIANILTGDNRIAFVRSLLEKFSRALGPNDIIEPLNGYPLLSAQATESLWANLFKEGTGGAPYVPGVGLQSFQEAFSSAPDGRVLAPLGYGTLHVAQMNFARTKEGMELHLLASITENPTDYFFLNVITPERQNLEFRFHPNGTIDYRSGE